MILLSRHTFTLITVYVKFERITARPYGTKSSLQRGCDSIKPYYHFPSVPRTNDVLLRFQRPG